MRFIKKYKVWIKRPDISIPPRILKFKKSKWKPVKKLITTRRIFLSPKKIQKNIHSATKIIWKRLKYRFKNNLLFKTQYKCRFDFSINLKHMEKFYNKHKKLIMA